VTFTQCFGKVVQIGEVYSNVEKEVDFKCQSDVNLLALRCYKALWSWFCAITLHGLLYLVTEFFSFFHSIVCITLPWSILVVILIFIFFYWHMLLSYSYLSDVQVIAFLDRKWIWVLWTILWRCKEKICIVGCQDGPFSEHRCALDNVPAVGCSCSCGENLWTLECGN